VKKSELHLKTEERIDQYVSGKLSQEQIDEVWAEILADSHNYDYLKTTVSLRNIVRETSNPDSTPTISKGARSTVFRKYAIAAGLALTLGSTGVYLYTNNSNTELQPLQVLEFTTLRSSADFNSDDLQRNIQQAINLAISGQSVEAVHLLETIFHEQSDPTIQSEVLMNVGIIQYNASDYESAIQTFSQLLSQVDMEPMLSERAQWNLAQSYMAQGNLDEARASFEVVVAMDGAHSRVARTYLKSLR
jgi:TolA-binding protein